jgi:hypothetical protein
VATFELTGMAQIQQRLHQLLPALQAPMAQALTNEANAILDASHQLCPVDTGALVSSGEVEPAQQTGTTTEVTIRYGDHGRVWYAALIEFDITMNHPHGGQAHFLKAPVMIATARFTDRIAASLQGAIR